MKFMILVKATKESEAGVMPTNDLMVEMVGFHEEMAKAGVLVDGAGLKRSAEGWRVKYGKGGPHHYTQKEASKLARRLPAADVLICHCPPLGINDDPDDPAHVGFAGLLDWVERHQPRHILHGHTHPLGGHVMTRFGASQVHWVSGARVITLG